MAYTRFLTHFALLVFCYNPSNRSVIKDSISSWMDELVVLFIKRLALSDDLSHMMIVYASLLSENTILEVLPSLLVHVDSNDQRRTVVQHIYEFLSSRKQDLDLEVIRRVVQLILALGGNEEAGENWSKALARSEEGSDTVSWLDMKKMNAILVNVSG
jgi:Nuclear pore protein 84 / 107